MQARVLFAGGITAQGYREFGEELLPRGGEARVCLLQGAPGTGKSALLCRLGEAWGTRDNVTAYVSADDPDKLAAVTAGAFAALDASPPHALPPCLPGMEALSVDLGQCLDTRALRPSREEGRALAARIALLTARATRCLRGAQAAWEDCAAVYAQAVDGKALRALRLQLLETVSGAPGEVRQGMAQAVTGKGVLSHMESLQRENMIYLDLPFGFDAAALLDPLSAALRARGVGHWRGMRPEMARVAHLCTDTHAVVSFCEAGQAARTLPFDEALLRREQSALAFDRAAYELWVGQAVEALAEARACRERLERIYADAVNPRLREELYAQALAWFE